jgi:hypothetical protein
MTLTQIYLFTGIYLVVFVVVALLTRATWRRIVGALAGGLAIGPLLLGVVALGERAGWWHMVIHWEPYYLAAFLLGLSVCGFVFLITWRIARRFGGRGLAVVLLIAAVIGPPRDYTYLRLFPEWGRFGPGVAPVLAVSATYVLFILLGHAVMRVVAGPARADPLARRPREPA